MPCHSEIPESSWNWLLWGRSNSECTKIARFSAAAAAIKAKSGNLNLSLCILPFFHCKIQGKEGKKGKMRRKRFRLPDFALIFTAPHEIARCFEAPRSAISSAKKIASEPRFLLRRKWVKLVLAAEFRAIPSSAVEIASKRRCAILVHCRDSYSVDPVEWPKFSLPNRCFESILLVFSQGKTAKERVHLDFFSPDPEHLLN